jgi:methionyl-tRNA formyltransferase
MIRIVFMGTPDFAVPVLQTLIAREQLVGVVTQPDRPAGRGQQLQPPPVKVAAQAADLPIYQPKSLRSEEAAAPLRDWQPDLIVVAAFGQILRPHVLNLPPYGCLNIHASLLPRWRGASPIQHAILAGDSETGVSLMRMDVGMDTGPVYIKQAIPIQPNETAATLHDRLSQLGAQMLDQYLDDILAGRLPAQPQDDSQATYAPLIKKEAGQLNWQQSAAELDRLIRAMTPWPGAFTTWQGKMLKVLEAAPMEGTQGNLPSQGEGRNSGELKKEDGEPGEVLASGVVATGDGRLQLLEVQLEGKKPTPIADFLRGRPEFVGGRLQ